MRAMRWRLAAAAVLVASVVTPARDGRAAVPDCDWAWVHPAPPRQDIYRAVAHAGRFLAVGAGGTTLWSLDGLRWELGDADVDADLLGVEWGGGWYVAVGDGVVLRSYDGRQWSVVDRRDGVRLVDVAFAAQRFVAVGEGLGASVLTSPSGIHWTVVDAPWAGTAVSVVATDTGFVVAVGTEIWESADGLDWSFAGAVPAFVGSARAAARTKALRSDLFELGRVDLAWSGQALLWATGSELWSRDVEGEWELEVELVGCASFEDWLGVIAGPGWALASGISGCPTPILDPVVSFYFSSDGGATFPEPWQDELGGFPALARYGDLWVALGALGDAMSSTNAADWQCPDEGCTSLACADELVDVAVGDAALVAVGGVGLCDDELKRRSGATVATSGDGGVEWAIHPLDVDRFRGVAWTGSEFLAVGHGWQSRSASGEHWTTEAFQDGAELEAVAIGDGWLVAAGRDGALYISEGSSAWIKPYLDYREDFHRVFWDGEQFLVVGTGGVILRSEDAFNWSQALTGTEVDINGVAAGFGQRIAVGDGGLVLASPNGVVWTPRWSGFTGELGDVAFGGDRFVAVGWEERPNGHRPAVVLVSADGEQWTRFDVPGEALRRVQWTGDAWIAVGGERSVLRAECLWALLGFDTQRLQVAYGGTANLEVRLSTEVALDTVLTVTSSRPDEVVVPSTVAVPPGSDRVVIPVSGVGLVTDALLTVALPEYLGSGRASIQVTVQPPLWTPRRPSGRVTP